MGKLRKATLILGEGPTEFYFFNSLCNRFKGITIKPDCPKHTNLKDLEKKIEEGVEMGYSQIFCVMDMDTKDNKIENDKYIKLKQKYANPINKPKKGIHCVVTFFETHLCDCFVVFKVLVKFSKFLFGNALKFFAYFVIFCIDVEFHNFLSLYNNSQNLSENPFDFTKKSAVSKIKFSVRGVYKLRKR